jgi:hypothetical protein
MMRHKISSRLLVAFLLAGVLVNLSCSKSPTDSGANYNGTWSGTTSQGKTVSFTVANNLITSITVGLFFQACGLEVSIQSSPTQNISGNRFSYTHQGAGSLATSYTITGTFSSNGSISGDLQLNFRSGYPYTTCTENASATWSATKK